MNPFSLLLWPFAILGSLAVIMVLWARRVVRQVRRETQLYASSIHTEHPGPHPRVVHSKRVRSLIADLEEHGYDFLGACCNRTKHDRGRPNIDLVFLSPDKQSNASVSCLVCPRTIVWLNLPWIELTGWWYIALSEESRLSDGSWVITANLNYSQNFPPQFRSQCLGEDITTDALLEAHQQKLRDVLAGHNLTVMPVVTLSSFLHSQCEQHKVLAPDLQKHTERAIDDAAQNWPVPIDVDHAVP
jgi:hypothetical protein